MFRCIPLICNVTRTGSTYYSWPIRRKLTWCASELWKGSSSSTPNISNSKFNSCGVARDAFRWSLMGAFYFTLPATNRCPFSLILHFCLICWSCSAETSTQKNLSPWLARLNKNVFGGQNPWWKVCPHCFTRIYLPICSRLGTSEDIIWPFPTFLCRLHQDGVERSTNGDMWEVSLIYFCLVFVDVVCMYGCTMCSWNAVPIPFATEVGVW